MTLLRSVLLLILALLASPVAAQAPMAPNSSPGTLVVATHEAPPFAMKRPDGQWQGLAIDLWRGVAHDLNLNFRLQETSLPDMVDGVAQGRYAASVGALTVTPGRELKIDFTHPYYTTGFGIAVGKSPPAWLVLLRNFFTWGFLQAVLALVAVLLVIGILFWWAERRANDEQFGGPASRGIGAGFWFSAVTMTTVGYGDKAPRTLAGRVIATIWMFAAIIIISTFTGMIASSLTESRLSGQIKNADDLASAKVGSIEGSAAEDWLNRTNVGFQRFTSIKAGLDAVASGQIDAFVYDRPLLRYVIKQSYSGKLKLVPGDFGRQDYAFGLPQGSKLREGINESLLRRIDGQPWNALVTETLGADQ
ncbi:transporter substrate-binding domain-containing protein [Sphingomonas oryzagri]|uniref:Transporter substrate-binding domain-containing protein n=1 Tax=Sphingomonas oryzagri TaxID=3042314 RepID=A0ABT6MYX4_9SPHN|nr:transporter substrate-binding domain-containing protein [Sphingomonas oryzagri]MDH7638197.1 transporter substrate-binding domain-containing protein [Sphingomonas oryzagri]